MSQEFIAGNIANCLNEWKFYTSDEEILNTVQGFHIPFVDDEIPFQMQFPNEIEFSLEDKLKINFEFDHLIKKRVITPAEHSVDEFISNNFCRPKPNGRLRIILNLQKLNDHVVYKHFKMETLVTALLLINKNCFMASIDLKDAYYSVPINKEDRKFLRFNWNNKLFEYTCLPNGLACAPRIFTKLLKPVFSYLRSLGYISVYYLDDCLLIGNTELECSNNVRCTLEIFQRLGFTINYEKSCLTPSNSIIFLGFLLNSSSMTIRLPSIKINKIKSACNNLIVNRSSVTIRELASLIGLLVSTFPAIKFGPLFYRNLESDKNISLREVAGNFDRRISLSSNSVSDIQWWLSNIDSEFNFILESSPSIWISSDASNLGWGAERDGKTTGGRWDSEESLLHINVLELKAVLFALQSLCSDVKSKHIRIRSDNVTAVTYINNMGGMKSSLCNSISKNIWNWARITDNNLTAEHLAGTENTIADKASRVFHDCTEWQLENFCFDWITNMFGNPDVDLFASRLNRQCKVYASWKPDPGAWFIDAFSRNWANFVWYAFPPFCLINLCLRKITVDKAEGIIIVPLWPTQPWFPRLLRMLTETPVVLPRDVLKLPYNNTRHPLRKTLRLMSCLVSGNFMKAKEFRRQQPRSCLPPGDRVPKFNINRILENGEITVLEGRLIRCVLMK